MRGKLELTWVGKDERPRLEQRVLVEDPSKSYGDPNSENMLIFGDNLLALKALEQDFASRIKCIYIYPPFNTGQAFEHYEDGLEHSIWLSLMREKLEARGPAAVSPAARARGRRARGRRARHGGPRSSGLLRRTLRRSGS